jgi:hypothetical protein
MKRIQIELGDLHCKKTSFDLLGLVDDKTYIMTFVGDPTTKQVFKVQTSPVWKLSAGMHVPQTVLADVNVQTAAAVSWTLIVMEQDFTGLNQNLINQALGVANNYMASIAESKVSLGLPALPVDDWMVAIAKAFIRALIDLIKDFAEDDILGIHAGKIAPFAAGITDYQFDCSGDSCDYHAVYTVRLA